MTRFGKVVKLKGFKPFTSAANALEQINNPTLKTGDADLNPSHHSSIIHLSEVVGLN